MDAESAIRLACAARDSGLGSGGSGIGTGWDSGGFGREQRRGGTHTGPNPASYSSSCPTIRLKVTQRSDSGACGFGARTLVEGTYDKVRARRGKAKKAVKP